jgi:ribonuclease P protein component
MAVPFWPAAVPKAASSSLSDPHDLNGRCGFPPTHRLLRPAEFQAVFDSAAFKVGEAQFLLLVRPNGLHHARLGLVIAKKKVRRSVDRNRLKRTVRESFRLHQASLPAADMIFMARNDLASIPSETLRQALVQGWRRVQRKAVKAVPEKSGSEKLTSDKTAPEKESEPGAQV